MLTIEQIIELEVRIEEEMERLEAESSGSEAERETVAPDKAIGRLSRLDAMQMQEVAKDADRRRELRHHQLEAARDRIDNGEFGQCERCGEWIPFERLDAQPEAVHCGRCAD